jgi:hypothetical protein
MISFITGSIIPASPIAAEMQITWSFQLRYALSIYLANFLNDIFPSGNGL